jgi:hypothetical protein
LPGTGQSRAPLKAHRQWLLDLVAAEPPGHNPIEMAFSKLKTALRKGAARTVTTLMTLIGKLIKTLAPEPCTNYFRDAGYR